MEYLKNYVSEDVYSFLSEYLDKNIIKRLKVSKDNVINILEYFKQIGVNNLKDVFVYRIDLLFKNFNQLKEKIEKYDKEMIKFIMYNDIGNLVNFGI